MESSAKQSIVITGAAGGIGSALAAALTGHNLTLADLECDVRDPQAMTRLADTAFGAFGGIDLWLHCAGRGINRNPMATTGEDLAAMVEINAGGVLHAMQACLPYFKAAGRGRFLAISSALVGDLHRSPHRFAYTASKAVMEAVVDLFDAQETVGFRNISLEWIRLPGVATSFAANALHATPSGVSSSPSLLIPEDAARLLLAAVGL